MKYSEFIKILKEGLEAFKITEKDKQNLKTIFKIILLLFIATVTLVLPIYAICYIVPLLGFINKALELGLIFIYFILWDLLVLVYLVFSINK